MHPNVLKHGSVHELRGDGVGVAVGTGECVGVGDGVAVGQVAGITTPLLQVLVQTENHMSPSGCVPQGRAVGVGEGDLVGVGEGLNLQQTPVVQLTPV